MKLIKPSVEYILQPEGLDGIYKHIEKCARTCYKSEDRITEDSAKKMVDALIKNKHTAMLEHSTIYLGKLWIGSVCHSCNQTMADEFIDKYAMNPYSKVVVHNNDICVSTNYRVLIENNWLDDLKYLCQPTEHHQKRYTLKFTCDRGVSHELVRHRVFSFAQESQRYCNYSKDKFDNEITFICPSWLNLNDGKYYLGVDNKDLYNTAIYGDGFIAPTIEWEYRTDTQFLGMCINSEQYYKKLIELDCTPQQARSVLPNATKTEIVITGFEDDWRHFFDLRLRGTTGKPHPDMLTVATLAWNEFKNKLNLEL